MKSHIIAALVVLAESQFVSGEGKTTPTLIVINSLGGI